VPTTPQPRLQIQVCVGKTQRSMQFDHGLTYAWRKPMGGGAQHRHWGGHRPPQWLPKRPVLKEVP
jgi:hypothetical protein